MGQAQHRSAVQQDNGKISSFVTPPETVLCLDEAWVDCKECGRKPVNTGAKYQLETI
jgi:hypothetical protein